MASILLAEDDAPLAQVFTKWLQMAGHTVQHVADGAKGIKSIAFDGIPDLLITDVMMPEYGGADFTTAFAMLAPDTPVIVVTAYSDDAILQRLREEPNVRQILAKPVSQEEFLAAVENALG